jgi:hypothetical protein
MTKPPMLNSIAPNRGPVRSPIPAAPSTQPMYFSLSFGAKELMMAMLAVELAPAPIPPKTYAIKLIIRNLSLSFSNSKYPNITVYAIINKLPNIMIICLPPILCRNLPTRKHENIYATAMTPMTMPTHIMSIPFSLALRG